MMKITYIGHSGFLVELNDTYLLFDYYEGDIPKLNRDKECYVFVSHNHHDHYNPKIWMLNHPKDKIKYIVSSDIELIDAKMKDVIEIGPYEKMDVDQVKIETLKSTDEGVAYIVSIDGKTIFHAGDLNFWMWKDESDEYNNQMGCDYRSELRLISDRKIDVAFLPLDPRLEEFSFLGIETFNQYVEVEWIIPMHFWKNLEIIDSYNQSHEKQVIKINYEGEQFTFN